MKTGIELITKERQRQIDVEGWTPEHDDEHVDGQLAKAAACYADPFGFFQGIPSRWPWFAEWYKPSANDRVRDLVKAGALIAAEIDRLQRIQSA